MKDAAIFGEFDSDNVGDRLIGEGARILFEDLGLTCDTHPLEDIARGGRAGTGRDRRGAIRAAHRWLYRQWKLYAHAIDAAILWRSRDQYRAYVTPIIDASDLVVVGGGQLLSDNSLRMLLRVWWITDQCVRLHRDIMYVGLGIGAPRSALSKFLLRAIMKRAGGAPFIVRDQKSALLAAAYRSPGQPPPKVLPDCAVPAVCQFREANCQAPDPLSVGLAPMSTLALPPAVATSPINSAEFWANVAVALTRTGFRPSLFCSGVHGDFDRCREVQATLAKRGLNIPVLKRPESSRQLLEQLQSMNHILGQRLHISISFLMLGRMPTSIGWDHKVDEFFAAQGLANRVIHGPDAVPEAVSDLVVSGHGIADAGGLLVRRLRGGVADALTQLVSA